MSSSLSHSIFTKKNDLRFGVFSSFRFDRDIFVRLMRFGIPGSLQFTMDILAFTLFILLVGRIGRAELAATNIVLSINALAFMPSMGVSQGMSVLVGQALGKKKASPCCLLCPKRLPVTHRLYSGDRSYLLVCS